MLDGLRYAASTPEIRAVLVRAAAFGFCAGAAWALLPVVADQELGGGPLTYGLLLGALGIGAVIGGFGVVPIRRRFGSELLVRAGTLAFGAATAVLGTVAVLPVLYAALMLGGAAWMVTMSSFNITVQLSAALWVKARTLAVYQMTAFGGLALGSAAFGGLAERAGLTAALSTAASLMLASMALGRSHRLAPAGGASSPG
jgi:hypothetical protein